MNILANSIIVPLQVPVVGVKCDVHQVTDTKVCNRIVTDASACHLPVICQNICIKKELKFAKCEYR